VALQAQRVIGGVMAVADQVVEAVQQLRVVEQQRVQVEEFAHFLRERTVQALAQAVHLGADDADRVVQALQFGGDVLDPLLDDIQHMREADPGAPQRTAARGTLAGELAPHQLSSSKRRSNRSQTACAASASSSPWTLSRTGVP